MPRKRDIAKELLIGLLVCVGLVFIVGKSVDFAMYFNGWLGGSIFNAPMLIVLLFLLFLIAGYFMVTFGIKRGGWNVSVDAAIVSVFLSVCLGLLQIFFRNPLYRHYLKGFAKRAQTKLDRPAALGWADSIFTNDVILAAAKKDPYMPPEQVSDLFINVFGSKQRGYLLEGDTQQPIAIFVGSLGRDAYGLVLLNTNVSIESLSSGKDYLPIGPRIYAFHANR